MKNSIKLPDEVRIEKELAPIVPDFIANRLVDCVQLEEFVSKKNWFEVARIGHLLKGVCGGFGFNELGLLGETIEQLAKKRNARQLKDISKSIKRNLSIVNVIYE